jgi:hypothetical protein
MHDPEGRWNYRFGYLSSTQTVQIDLTVNGQLEPMKVTKDVSDFEKYDHRVVRLTKNLQNEHSVKVQTFILREIYISADTLSA